MFHFANARCLASFTPTHVSRDLITRFHLARSDFWFVEDLREQQRPDLNPGNFPRVKVFLLFNLEKRTNQFIKS